MHSQKIYSLPNTALVREGSPKRCFSFLQQKKMLLQVLQSRAAGIWNAPKLAFRGTFWPWSGMGQLLATGTGRWKGRERRNG